MKTIAGYVRVSTKSQVKDGDSLENQELRIKRYCDYHFPDAKLIIYPEQGKSGTKVKKRPEFQRLYEDLKNGKIEGVIFTDMTRAFRNMKEALEFSEFMKENKLPLCFEKYEVNTKTAAGSLFFKMIMMMAEFESEQMGERFKDASRERGKRGLRAMGRNPVGYHQDRGKLIPFPEEAEIVKQLFDKYLQTGSLWTAPLKLE